MANNSKSKLKLLYLKRILEEETDAERGVTMTQIVEKLKKLGVPAERKGIYRDLETLRDFGLDIHTYQRNPVQYAVIRHAFSLSELMLLVDAVESCKFLTKRQSNKLTTNLKCLATDHERDLLTRRIHVAGRIQSKTEGVFDAVDVLHEALRRHKKVAFKYYRYGLRGERTPTHNGKPHVVTPVGISFWDGNYYLTAWNDEHENFTEFRIDRMGKIQITEEAATKNDEISQYAFLEDEYEHFGRFGGECITATLVLDADKVEIVMDRFGRDIELQEHSERTAKTLVKIHKSEQFFGWIAGLGGTVRIDGPERLKQEYCDYLRSLIESSSS